MFYSVQEVSNILQVTRATVYNRIDKMKELNKHVKIKDNVKYIDDEGLELLKVSMNKQEQCQKQSKTEEKIIEYIDSSKVVGDYTTIQKLIETLERQLEIKDRQLESKDEQIKALTDTMVNNSKFQMMLENKVLMLEQGKQEQQEQTKDTITPEPEKQHDNELMDSIKQLHDKISSMESHNNESAKQLQDKILELETEKKDSLKQLQDEISLMKLEQNKGFWVKFKNRLMN